MRDVPAARRADLESTLSTCEPVTSASIDEHNRLRALHALSLLDTPPESAYDRITALAARLFNTPLAFVSLIDSERQWFKSRHGMDVCEIPRRWSFCNETIRQKSVVVVPDTASDPRFADNPLVTGEHHLRFYAGAPLHSPDGYALGTLCVLDRRPRTFGPAARQTLADLAAVVEREMELGRMARQLEQTAALAAASREKYRRLFQFNPQPVWVYDTQTLRFLAVNDAAVRRYGYTEEEFLSLSIADVRPPEDVPALLNACAAARRTRSDTGQWRHLSKSGALFWVEINSQGFEFEGRPARLVVVNDVTEKKQAADARREAEENYRAIFDNSPEGIFQTTPEGRFLRVNPALARIAGYDSPEEMKESVYHLARDLYVDAGRRDEFMRQIVEHGSVHDFEAQFYRKNGTVVWTSLDARAVRDKDGGLLYYEGTAQDITERKTLEAEREAQLADALQRAMRDPLTGLLNHRAFHAQLEAEADRAQREGQTLGIAVLDMDAFEFFNDAHGHAAGDDILRRVASALGGACRSYDTLARYGGDEFALLLPGVDRQGLHDLRARLRAATEHMGYQPPGASLPVPLHVSVGVALFPEDGPGRLDALTEAHTALRRAKSGGGDEYADELRATLSARREGFSMLDALVAAVDNKDRYTRQHSEDVCRYVMEMARALGLDEAQQQIVKTAALLHDVGKIGVPDRILRKPGPLTDAEFEAVMQHPMMGAIIVGAVPGFEETLDAVRHHHERWDGGGYPFGLRGTEIPLMARMMAVADAFSAMTTDRPYRRGMAECKALSILQDGAGTQWDAECVAAFVSAHMPASQVSGSAA